MSLGCSISASAFHLSFLQAFEVSAHPNCVGCSRVVSKAQANSPGPHLLKQIYQVLKCKLIGPKHKAQPFVFEVLVGFCNEWRHQLVLFERAPQSLLVADAICASYCTGLRDS